MRTYNIGFHSEIRKMSQHKLTIRCGCATSEDSDQPTHPCSLIRVFTDCMCLLQPPGYPKRAKWGPLLDWVDVQADLSVCWLHRSYCRFSCALAQIIFGYPTYLELWRRKRNNEKNLPQILSVSEVTVFTQSIGTRYRIYPKYWDTITP